MTILLIALLFWLTVGIWLTNNLMAYPASAAVTISPASLASSATWLAGRESTLVDNTSNLYLDYLLSGKITVGTSPTAGTEIRICVIGMIDDSEWPDVFDGTDSAETITSAGVGSGFLKLAAVMLCDATTSDRAYPFGPISVASLFGGVCPAKFIVFVTHNTGVNLNATAGNHEVNVKGAYTTNSG